MGCAHWSRNSYACGRILASRTVAALPCPTRVSRLSLTSQQNAAPASWPRQIHSLSWEAAMPQLGRTPRPDPTTAPSVLESTRRESGGEAKVQDATSFKKDPSQEPLYQHINPLTFAPSSSKSSHPLGPIHARMGHKTVPLASGGAQLHFRNLFLDSRENQPSHDRSRREVFGADPKLWTQQLGLFKC